MKRIYLIDCPGVVPPSNNDSEEDILLRGVVRVENVENPEQYIAAVLKRCKPQHIERTYDVKGYNTPIEFLELLARKGGRLLKGGEADVDGVAKMILNDFLRGKIPWFTPPPVVEGGEGKGVAGREGRLGEMGKKRKRGDEQASVDATDLPVEQGKVVDGEAPEAVDDFESFEDEGSDQEPEDREELSSSEASEAVEDASSADGSGADNATLVAPDGSDVDSDESGVEALKISSEQHSLKPMKRRREV